MAIAHRFAAATDGDDGDQGENGEAGFLERGR